MKMHVMEAINEIINKLKQKIPLLDKDYQILLDYLENGDNEKEFKKVLNTHWDEVCDNEDLVLNEPDDLYYKIYHRAIESQQPVSSQRISIMGWVQRIAAILFLPLLMLSAWNYLREDEGTTSITETVSVSSPVNAKTRFFLPDGTQGWLQANSSIHYSLLDNVERSVTLEGEAYFDVKRNEKQPFIVSTDDFKVKVLGTRFNVSADKDMPVSKVFLEEGKVEMLGVNDEHHVVLKPGEEYLYNRTLHTFDVNAGLADETLAWTKGILLLKNKSLKESVIALEKFYNVEITILDKELEEMPVYAKIQHEQLDEVLELAKLILPISYKIEKPKKLNDGTYSKRKVVIQKSK